MSAPALWACTWVSQEQKRDLRVDRSIMVLKMTDYDVSSMAQPGRQAGPRSQYIKRCVQIFCGVLFAFKTSFRSRNEL